MSYFLRNFAFFLFCICFAPEMPAVDKHALATVTRTYPEAGTAHEACFFYEHVLAGDSLPMAERTVSSDAAGIAGLRSSIRRAITVLTVSDETVIKIEGKSPAQAVVVLFKFVKNSKNIITATVTLYGYALQAPKKLLEELRSIVCGRSLVQQHWGKLLGGLGVVGFMAAVWKNRVNIPILARRYCSFYERSVVKIKSISSEFGEFKQIPASHSWISVADQRAIILLGKGFLFDHVSKRRLALLLGSCDLKCPRRDMGIKRIIFVLEDGVSPDQCTFLREYYEVDGCYRSFSTLRLDELEHLQEFKFPEAPQRMVVEPLVQRLGFSSMHYSYQRGHSEDYGYYNRGDFILRCDSLYGLRYAPRADRARDEDNHVQFDRTFDVGLFYSGSRSEREAFTKHVEALPGAKPTVFYFYKKGEKWFFIDKDTVSDFSSVEDFLAFVYSKILPLVPREILPFVPTTYKKMRVEEDEKRQAQAAVARRSAHDAQIKRCPYLAYRVACARTCRFQQYFDFRAVNKDLHSIVAHASTQEQSPIFVVNYTQFLSVFEKSDRALSLQKARWIVFGSLKSVFIDGGTILGPEYNGVQFGSSVKIIFVDEDLGRLRYKNTSQTLYSWLDSGYARDEEPIERALTLRVF